VKCIIILIVIIIIIIIITFKLQLIYSDKMCGETQMITLKYPGVPRNTTGETLN
jgi:uncharacterized protein YxeA